MRCAIYIRVSTDDQRDNGYSIDSQLRMIKEYCEKNNYDIVDVYNDAGHSGKDLMRPEMQRLLKDIKSHKINKLIAIKVDRLTRNNYDGFWLLNYCEQHDVKIELILEPYDVSTANGEMIFGMNLVFGQRERKEIGARTKRAMEEMALEKVHPSKAPYGYTRNPLTGHLEIEPIEGQVVKEIFELCKQGKSTRGIATIMRNNNSYLKTGKWTSDRIYKILTNSIYIGIFEYGKYCRKPQDILIVKDYCEPIIDEETWKITRANLEKNKHPNYGEHIHLFTGIIKCPNCGKILSSTNSYKNSRNPHAKIYYHVTCKNPNCKSKGIHYSSDKIEEKLARVLNELTRYMYDIESEIIVCNSIKTKDIKDIDNAIEKLKQQEKKLVDLYLSSTLNFETINHRNDLIKKEIENLNKKKQQIDPYDELKDYTVELLKKLDCDVENDKVISNNKLAFSFVFNSLNRQAKKELIKKLFDKIEIKRTKNYEVEITNIKFTEEFISKSSKTYLKYLDEILQNNNIGFIYKESIDIQELKKLQENYFIFSCRKMENEEYSQTDLEKYMALLEEHFYKDGVITCPYIEDGNVADHLTLIPKIYIYVLASTAFVLPHKFKYGFSTPYPKINMKGTKKKMNDEKVNYLIAMIKDMDIENKLRLAICMSDNSTTHLEYDKKETYKHFDLLLKEIHFEYRTTAVNFANYPFIMFAMAKIMEMDSYEQNKVALYLFNSINYKIKKYVNVDETLDNCKQMF